MGLDTLLFRWVNATSANPCFDLLMPWATRGGVVQTTLILVGLALVVAAYAGHRPDWIRHAWRTVIVAVVAVLVADFLASSLLKPCLHRPRPPYALPDVRLLVQVGPSFSFPSSHAVNTAAVATALSRAYGWWALPALAYAALIAYSRVYVGVHFPLDVVAGAVLGVGVAELVWRCSARFAGEGGAR